MAINHHNHSATTIFEIDHQRVAYLHRRISSPPQLLPISAGRATCSIFKVPNTFFNFNGNLYEPQIISIGPFHHGRPHLQMMEEHKYHYLRHLLHRTGIEVEYLLRAVAPLEPAAREAYSKVITYSEHEFIEMMVVDGCFVIELLRKVGKSVAFEMDDPIASMSWIFPSLLRDLHKLENQIPFFVLRRLFDATMDTKVQNQPSLSTLALNFFNYTLQRPPEVLGNYWDLNANHLLDLLRSSFITPSLDPQTRDRALTTKNGAGTPSHVILSVSKLRRAGIKLWPSKSESFLEVGFKRGFLQMPTVTLDDFMGLFLANCVAYEQCHKGCSSYFTTYATLLDCLVNSADDVEYLCDKNIVENYFGTEVEITRLINNLGKDVAFDIDQCYLARLFNEVNEYYHNSWHVQWASFKYTYFNTPWSFISAVAAFVLLGLTVMQTLYTMLSYYDPSKS